MQKRPNQDRKNTRKPARFLKKILISRLTVLTHALVFGQGYLWKEQSMQTLVPAWIGTLILAVFGLAYLLVFAEERIHLRKSKPMMVAAGLIWVLVALGFQLGGNGHEVGDKLEHVLVEYTELFLFLLSATTFIATMVERNVFEALRSRLSASNLSVRGIFWMTGVCAFSLVVIDNMTRSLLMGTVVLATLPRDRKIVGMCLINVVVAANAGGAFSPFGDITTLMIWQKGMVPFADFFHLFLPSFVNWIIPAAIMSFFLPHKSAAACVDKIAVKKGGFVVVGLFIATIAVTVSLDHFLELPTFLGMMMGLGTLNFYSYFLHRSESKALALAPSCECQPFNIFSIFEKTEWDTFLFFYGVMLCVGALGAIGYLDHASKILYNDFGSTYANVAIGLLSAIVDNIPLVFGVLTMNPTMDQGQWLLVTLTAGVGGSILSIGSAAGVALMGLGKEGYTFTAHLKWSWAILLGYAASIMTHLWVNEQFFTN
jgi:Na+/H+ antiporter NhaD/arsenite permease-like protein